MANGLTPEQTSQLSRSGIKKLIKTYNDSNQQDKATLSLIIEQLARTSLYFIIAPIAVPIVIIVFINGIIAFIVGIVGTIIFV